MKPATSHLHLDVLPLAARPILKQLATYTPKGVLGGGTAIALQLGHRRSFDLDVFLATPIQKKLLSHAKQLFGAVSPLVDTPDELTCEINHTKVSVIFYPFKPLHPLQRMPHIPLFDLRDLASSKAYTIGRRGVWRDYVDIFSLVQHGLKLSGIIKEAEQRFGESFNAKLFLEQLSFFEDIHDFTIEWVAKQYSPNEVKAFLVKQVSDYLKKL